MVTDYWLKGYEIKDSPLSIFSKAMAHICKYTHAQKVGDLSLDGKKKWSGG